MQQAREDLQAYAEHSKDSRLPEWEDEYVDVHQLLRLACEFQTVLRSPHGAAQTPRRMPSQEMQPEPEPELNETFNGLASVVYGADFMWDDDGSKEAPQPQTTAADEPARARIVVQPSSEARTKVVAEPDGSGQFIVYSFDVMVGGNAVHRISGRFSDLRAQHSKLGELLERDIVAHSSQSGGRDMSFPSRLLAAAPLQITSAGGLTEGRVKERSSALSSYYAKLLEDNDGRMLRQAGEHRIKELHSALGLTSSASAALLDVSRGSSDTPAAAALNELFREGQHQAQKPATFCKKQMAKLNEQITQLCTTMAELDNVESVAGAGVVDVSFKAERKVTLKACRSLYHAVELLKDFALTNAEHCGQVAKFVDRSCEAVSNGSAGHLAGLQPNAGMAWMRDCPPLLELRAMAHTGCAELSQELRKLLQQQLNRGEGSAGAITTVDDYLTSTRTKALTANPIIVFGFGFTAGFCLCLSIVITHLFTSTTVWEPRYLFFSWRPHLQICLCLWLWGFNILVFERFGINHVLVLGISPHPEKYLHASSLMWCAAIWSTLALIGFWLQVSHAWVYVTDEPESPPVVVWGLVVGFMMLPTTAPWSLWTSRRRILRTFVRVLAAGWVPVLWRDVLLANIISSLVKALVDINHSACYAWTETFFEEGQRLESLTLNIPIDECGCLSHYAFDHVSKSCVEGAPPLNESDIERWCAEDDGEEKDLCEEYFTLDAVVTFLPYYFRFAQQVRRYIDSGFKSTRDLVNAGKYSTSLAVVTLSWMDHTYTSLWTGGAKVSKWDITASPIKIAWAAMVLICALYKLIWDIKQDWKLGDSNAPHRFLRKRLVYPPIFYYCAIAQDTVLRFSWALTISPSFFRLNHLSDLWLSTAFATLEVWRRFTWTLIRVEAEHVTNVGKQRAFADVPLPSMDRARLAATQNWGQVQDVGKVRRRRNRNSKNMRAELMAQTTVVS